MNSLKELFNSTKGVGFSVYHISVDAPPIVRYYGRVPIIPIKIGGNILSAVLNE